jgi:hypothetical protein
LETAGYLSGPLQQQAAPVIGTPAGQPGCLVSLLQKHAGVIPTEAGIQSFEHFLVPGLRRGGGIHRSCKSLSGSEIHRIADGQRRVEENSKRVIGLTSGESDA